MTDDGIYRYPSPPRTAVTAIAPVPRHRGHRQNEGLRAGNIAPPATPRRSPLNCAVLRRWFFARRYLMMYLAADAPSFLITY